MYRNPVTSQYILDFKKCPIEGVLTIFGGPVLSSKTFLIFRKAFIHIKTPFHKVEHDFVEGYRNVDESHVAPTDRSTSTAKARCCLDHNMFETETSRATNIPLHPFHRTPPVSTNITATCSKKEVATLHSE
ncbi:hypothetical protein TNCV_2025381 [Trichonephila clavipes]|nr:hypothetical protein TNCV_2025381 [Trichonephila clavipes]